MIICKKEHYHKILDNNKNNIRGIWKLLNNIIRNGSGQVHYPQYFVENDKKNIYNMTDVVNRFNSFEIIIL